MATGADPGERTRLVKDAEDFGEESVEVLSALSLCVFFNFALAATVMDKEELRNEAADLLYHLTVLLQACDMSVSDAVNVLRERHKG